MGDGAMPLKKIVSGGQTGVDRAALDAALAQGIACGGWCPKGRRAEDGAIPGHYPLSETDSGACLTGRLVLQRYNLADTDPSQAEVDAHVIRYMKSIEAVMRQGSPALAPSA